MDISIMTITRGYGLHSWATGCFFRRFCCRFVVYLSDDGSL